MGTPVVNRWRWGEVEFCSRDKTAQVGHFLLRQSSLKSTTYETAKMSQTSSISDYESTPSDPSTTIREVEEKLHRYVDKVNQQMILLESKMDHKFNDLNVSLFFC